MTAGGGPWDLPPADLHARPLPQLVIARGTPLRRIHSRDHHPHFFGPPRPKRGDPWPDPQNRFDDPLGEYGVCYLGLTDEAAFVETVLRDQYLPHLSEMDLADVYLADGEAARELHLARFLGSGLQRMHTSAASVHAPYEITQTWSRAIWTHPGRVDGIACRSGYDDDQQCIALFERASKALRVAPGVPILTLPHRLGPLLDRYKIALGS